MCGPTSDTGLMWCNAASVLLRNFIKTLQDVQATSFVLSYYGSFVAAESWGLP